MNVNGFAEEQRNWRNAILRKTARCFLFAQYLDLHPPVMRIVQVVAVKRMRLAVAVAFEGHALVVDALVDQVIIDLLRAAVR